MWSQMSWRQINPPSVGRSMLDDCQSRSACRPVTGASKYVSVLSGSIASSSASSGPVSRSVEPGSPTPNASWVTVSSTICVYHGANTAPAVIRAVTSATAMVWPRW